MWVCWHEVTTNGINVGCCCSLIHLHKKCSSLAISGPAWFVGMYRMCSSSAWQSVLHVDWAMLKELYGWCCCSGEGRGCFVKHAPGMLLAQSVQQYYCALLFWPNVITYRGIPTKYPLWFNPIHCHIIAVQKLPPLVWPWCTLHTSITLYSTKAY